METTKNMLATIWGGKNHVDCGHLYELKIIRDLTGREVDCPGCRSYNPLNRGQKIYLTYEDPSTKDKMIEDMTLNLDASMAHAVDLQEKLIASKAKFALGEKLSKSQTDGAQLQEVQDQLEQSILNASVLQAKLDETERNVADLSEELNRTAEKLKVSEMKVMLYAAKHDDGSEDMFATILTQSARKQREKDEKIKNLERDLMIKNAEENSMREELMRLEQLLYSKTRELEKKSCDIKELCSDKVKLQNCLEHFSSPRKLIKEPQLSRLMAPSAPTLIDIDPPMDVGAAAPQTPNGRATPINRPPQEEQAASISMTGFTEPDTKLKPVCILNKILKQMGWDFGGRSMYPLCYWKGKSLIITFNSAELLYRFMANKPMLLEHPVFKNVTMSTETKGTAAATAAGTAAGTCKSLYHYAQMLRKVGYAVIFYKNNTVYVRKTKHSPVLKIESSDHVNQLMKQGTNTDTPLVEIESDQMNISPITTVGEPIESPTTSQAKPLEEAAEADSIADSLKESVLKAFEAFLATRNN